MSTESKEGDGEAPKGVKVNAGDSLYIPAGALRISMKPDGTMDFGVTVAVDPWLPDLSANRETPLDVIEAISQDGFPIATICNREPYGCLDSTNVRDLIFNPTIQRLKHMAVHDGKQAIGVLDLDKARRQYQHNGAGKPLVVKDLYDPVDESNTMHGSAPLMDYLLTADRQAFRLIQLEGNWLAAVDVEDLQKVPVRAVLLMWFSYLESLLSERLFDQAPHLREILGTRSGADAAGLGTTGSGPERKIERYGFKKLLKEAKKLGLITLTQDQVEGLNWYRNSIFHGPRWYITRRGEVSLLVNHVKTIVSMAKELASS